MNFYSQKGDPPPLVMPLKGGGQFFCAGGGEDSRDRIGVGGSDKQPSPLTKLLQPSLKPVNILLLLLRSSASNYFIHFTAQFYPFTDSL